MRHCDEQFIAKNGKSLSPESWIPRQIQSRNNKRSGNILQTAPTAVSPWSKSYWRQPGELLRFEDSLSGIESGKAAGATVIGLATTLPLDAIKGKAHKTISDFAGFHISDMLSVKQN